MCWSAGSGVQLLALMSAARSVRHFSSPQMESGPVQNRFAASDDFRGFEDAFGDEALAVGVEEGGEEAFAACVAECEGGGIRAENTCVGGQRFEARHGHQRDARGPRESFGGGDADAQAGPGAGALRDGEGGEFGGLKVVRSQRRLHQRDEGSAVDHSFGDVLFEDDASVKAEGDTERIAGGFEREERERGWIHGGVLPRKGVKCKMRGALKWLGGGLMIGMLGI